MYDITISSDAGRALGEFMFDLYQALLEGADEDPGNMLLNSTAWVALTMTAAGAAGETLGQMRRVLHHEGEVHPAVGALLRELERRSFGAGSREEGGVSLETAHGLFAQIDYPFRESFLRLVRQIYGARVENVDFANEANQVLTMVNGWVARKTHGMITRALTRANIHPLTRLLIIAVVYLVSVPLRGLEVFGPGEARDEAATKVKFPSPCGD